MANYLLALALIVVVATTQVAFATYPSKLCDPPRRIDYGGYSPYRPQYSVGSKIQFHCDKGYELYGSSWTVCKWDKRSYWAHPPPICKRRFTTTIKCFIRDYCNPLHICWSFRNWLSISEGSTIRQSQNRWTWPFICCLLQLWLWLQSSWSIVKEVFAWWQLVWECSCLPTKEE